MLARLAYGTTNSSYSITTTTTTKRTKSNGRTRTMYYYHFYSSRTEQPYQKLQEGGVVLPFQWRHAFFPIHILSIDPKLKSIQQVLLRFQFQNPLFYSSICAKLKCYTYAIFKSTKAFGDFQFLLFFIFFRNFRVIFTNLVQRSNFSNLVQRSY